MSQKKWQKRRRKEDMYISAYYEWFLSRPSKWRFIKHYKWRMSKPKRKDFKHKAV